MWDCPLMTRVIAFGLTRNKLNFGTGWFCPVLTLYIY